MLCYCVVLDYPMMGMERKSGIKTKNGGLFLPSRKIGISFDVWHRSFAVCGCFAKKC